MHLHLSRKQGRSLCYFVVFLTLYILYSLIFGHEETSVDPELPELIVQRGNERYFKGNVRISSTPVSQRKEYEWKAVKQSHGGSNEEFGKLNVHVWGEICGEELRRLKNHVLFPQFPSRRFYAKTTFFSHNEGNKHFGERIFGFIHPKISGFYSFLVQGASVEVWVSTDANSNHSKLVLKNPSSGSSKETQHGNFNLEIVAARKYYIEMLHKKGEQQDSFQLLWKEPGSNEFVELSGNDISLMLQDEVLGKGEIDTDNPVEEILHIHQKDPFPVNNDIEQARIDLYKLPFIQDVFLEDIFPSCEYKPSYLVDCVVSNYKGVWETHYNSLYPIDNTNVTQDGWVCLGNDVLPEKKAMHVVKIFMDALNKANYRKHRLKRILSVEENRDKVKGDRYLLELELQEIQNGLVRNESVRLSKYVYKLTGSESLSIPNGYQWNRDATVNIILTVGGRQGRWVQHFINNMAEIYRETKDENLNVVIIDFHSRDIDIRRSLEKSGLPRYILLHMKSKFHKTIGLQYAIKVVTDPNDIVFVCDLHLYLPVAIVDHIRKHCIQGKTAFNPVLIRLDCGFTANDPHGRWEHDGYGPIATYKSDWDRFGGMNVEKFKHSWGGEDWDMLDRMVTAGYEVERLKILNFFHFYHTKKGMWRESEQ